MKTSKSIRAILSVSSLLTPVLTFAFDWSSSTFYNVIDEILRTIAVVIPLLFAASFLIFFWGVSKFILNSGNKDEIAKGRSYMIWGVLALFVLISVRAIISLVATDLEIGNGDVIPLIPTSNSGNYENNDFGLPQGIPGGN